MLATKTTMIAEPIMEIKIISENGGNHYQAIVRNGVGLKTVYVALCSLRESLRIKIIRTDIKESGNAKLELFTTAHAHVCNARMVVEVDSGSVRINGDGWRREDEITARISKADVAAIGMFVMSLSLATLSKKLASAELERREAEQAEYLRANPFHYK